MAAGTTPRGLTFVRPEQKPKSGTSQMLHFTEQANGEGTGYVRTDEISIC